MSPHFHTQKELINNLELWSANRVTRIIGLTKIDCFLIHDYFVKKFGGVCEDLTWDNDLVFNCETYTHEDLYNNLFKLRFKGVPLGQE